jgi:hypothetical protein
VDFLRKRLPAQVGGYLEGVEFPARKEELLGRLERNGVPGPVLGSQNANIAVPRTSCRLFAGGVSRPQPTPAAAGSDYPQANFLEPLPTSARLANTTKTCSI